MDQVKKIAWAIRGFQWDDYGLDEVQETLEDSGTQDWVDDLAEEIAAKLGLG